MGCSYSSFYIFLLVTQINLYTVKRTELSPGIEFQKIPLHQLEHSAGKEVSELLVIVIFFEYFKVGF